MRILQITLLLTVSFCLEGCALWSWDQADTSRKDVISTATQTEVPETVDSPELAAIRGLWTGVQCSNPEGAERQLTALLAAAPNTSGALALRGLARSELGKKEEAFEDATAAVRQEPTARNYAWRALVLWRGGKERGALADAQYALRKDSAQPVAHIVLGLEAQARGDISSACGQWRQACDGGECSAWDTAKKDSLCK